MKGILTRCLTLLLVAATLAVGFSAEAATKKTRKRTATKSASNFKPANMGYMISVQDAEREEFTGMYAYVHFNAKGNVDDCSNCEATGSYNSATGELTLKMTDLLGMAPMVVTVSGKVTSLGNRQYTVPAKIYLESDKSTTNVILFIMMAT